MSAVKHTRRFASAYRWEIAIVIAIPALGWGWLVLWIDGPAGSISGLAYDVAWWTVIVVLPALLMGALHLCLRRRGYEWESLLLVAIPFWAVLAGVSYSLVLYRTPWLTDGGGTGLWLSLPDWGIQSQLFTIILLAVLYPAVRRLGRNFLSLVWQFLLAVEVIALVVDGLFVAMWLQGVSVASTSTTWDPRLLTALLSGPVAIFLLLRFIRCASRSSLSHAFFAVALALTFSWDQLFVFAGVMPESTFDYLLIASGGALVGALGLGTDVLTVWLLFNFDARGPAFRKRAVVALIVLRTLGGLALALLSILAAGHLPMLTSRTTTLQMLGVTFLGWSVVFWVVYLVRVRQPAPPQQA